MRPWIYAIAMLLMAGILHLMNAELRQTRTDRDYWHRLAIQADSLLYETLIVEGRDDINASVR